MFERKQCLALCLVVLAGCGGGGGSDGKKQGAPTLGGSSSGDGADLGGEGVATELEGTWVSGCADSDEAGLSMLETATFDKNRFESRVQYFDDNTCTTPSTSAETQVLAGTFAIGSPVATSSGLEAKALDLTIQSINGSAGSQTIYSIFYLDQSGLFLGSEQSTTPEDRPTTLDSELLTKQGAAGAPGGGEEPGSGTDAPETPVVGAPDDGGADGGGADGGGTDVGGPDDGGSDDGGTDANDVLAQAMAGQWKGECTANPSPGGSSHMVGQFSFSATGVDYRVDNYEDPDCTVQLSVGDFSLLRGTYSLGDTITTTDGLQATEIDFVFSELDGEAFGLEYQDLIAIDGNTLYLGTESETGSRTDSLNLQEPWLRQ